jgi:hypothetical protein
MVFKNSLGGVFVYENGRVIHQKEQKIMASLLQNDAERLIVHVHDVRTPILKRLLDFISFHLQDSTEREKKAFNSSFVEQCSQILCELASAAYYLDHKPLVNLTSKAIASQISGKTTEELREVLGTQNEPPMPASMTSHLPARFRLQAKVDSKKQKQKLAALAASTNSSGLPGLIEAPPAATTSPAPVVEDTRSVEDILAFLGEDVGKSSGKSKKNGKGKKSNGKKNSKDASNATSKDEEVSARSTSSKSENNKKGSEQQEEKQVQQAEESAMSAVGVKAGEEAGEVEMAPQSVSSAKDHPASSINQATSVEKNIEASSSNSSQKVQKVPTVVVVKGGEKKEIWSSTSSSATSATSTKAVDVTSRAYDDGASLSMNSSFLKKSLNLSGSSATSVTSSSSSYIMPGSSVGSTSSMGSAASRGGGGGGGGHGANTNTTNNIYAPPSSPSSSTSSLLPASHHAAQNQNHQIRQYHLAPAMCLECQNSVASCICPSFSQTASVPPAPSSIIPLVPVASSIAAYMPSQEVVEVTGLTPLSLASPSSPSPPHHSSTYQNITSQQQQQQLLSSSSSSSIGKTQYQQIMMMRSSSPSIVTSSPRIVSTTEYQQQQQQGQNVLDGSMVSRLTFPSPFTTPPTAPSVSSSTNTLLPQHLHQPHQHGGVAVAPQVTLPPFPGAPVPLPGPSMVVPGQNYVSIHNFFPSQQQPQQDPKTGFQKAQASGPPSSFDLPPGLEVPIQPATQSPAWSVGPSRAVETAQQPPNRNVDFSGLYGFPTTSNQVASFSATDGRGSTSQGKGGARLLGLSDPESQFSLETSSFNFPILTSSSSSAQYYWGDDDEEDTQLYCTSTSIGRPSSGIQSDVPSYLSYQDPPPSSTSSSHFHDYESELAEFRQSIEMDLLVPFRQTSSLPGTTPIHANTTSLMVQHQHQVK